MPISPPVRRRPYLREWLALALLVLVLVGLASQRASLQRLDHLVQDLGQRLLAPSPSADIVLVAIDDRSLAAIGRWPWRRALHAELIGQITRQHPRAIGMDLLLGEADTDYPEDDAVLAQAMARSARVVLPVARRRPHGIDVADLPLPLLRQAARQIGHVQMHVDSDGIARGFFEQEGPRDAPWPDFATALRCAAGTADAHCRGHARVGEGPWVQRAWRQIRFARGAPPFATHSYIDVLTGKAPPEAFSGKYVLVGATATGLGDLYAAPTASGSERIAGVELLAHALNIELAGIDVRAAPAAFDTAFNLAMVGAALLGLWLLGPLGSLLTCLLSWLLALALALLAPVATGLLLAPAPALLAIVLIYPLWSWRRLSFAAHFLQRELTALSADGLAAPVRGDVHGLGAGAMEARIQAVESATRQLRTLHHFIAGALAHLPSPTFVCDAAGRVTLATKAASGFAADGRALMHRLLPEVLGTLTHPETGQPLLPAWPPAAHSQDTPQEGRDASGRRWLMLIGSFAQGTRRHWLVTLTDLTAMREAQAQRDRALRFISHDLRSPASSILTLLQMQQALPDPLPEAELHARIARHAEAALAMARGFTQLASAQTQALRREPLDLVTLLQDAVQQAWASARQRQVALVIARSPASAPCEGDRELLARALANVIGNAIKFTAPGTEVRCTLDAAGPWWRLAVQDQGPGIVPEQQQRVFQPFQRLHAPSGEQPEGFGLGLAFVDDILRRHGARVRVQSDGAHGSTFVLELPAAAT